MRVVLAARRFRQSPRLGRLLRYLCSRALADEADRVTEYTIAVDVLGKSEGFKEGKDAIVRVEVHRLRKRLAEYYEEEGASHRVRIVIPGGNYAPQFLLCDDAPAEHPEEPFPTAGVIAPLVSPHPARRWKPRLSRQRLTIAALLTVVAAFAVYKAIGGGGRAIDTFWNPLLDSSNTVLICVGNEAGGHLRTGPEDLAKGPLTLKEFHSAQSQMVLVEDAATLARLAGLIASKGKRYRIVSQSEATYADLQNSPVVLVGLLNNDWTRRLVGELRFTVERPAPGKVSIRDRNHPLNHDWSIDYYVPYLDVAKDYALVLRATDPKTEQMTVTAAGLSAFGTVAAGEFLTNPAEMEKLNAVAPKGWNRRNLEVVLATQVIRGKPGPPVVIATHFW